LRGLIIWENRPPLLKTKHEENSIPIRDLVKKIIIHFPI